MSTTQKVLIGIPIALYLIIVCYLLADNHHNRIIGFILIGLFPFICLLLFVPASILHTVSSYRISITGGFVISIWVPMIILSQYVLWHSLGFIDTGPRALPAPVSNPKWETEFRGLEKVVNDSATMNLKGQLHFDETSVSHFQTVMPVADSFYTFAFFFFYDEADLNVSSTPKVICMLSDDEGHITASQTFSASDNALVQRIYQHKIMTFNVKDSMPLVYLEMNENEREVYRNHMRSRYTECMHAEERDSVYRENVYHIFK
ncbi:MAG: hypothetical protein JWO03_2141 [Bacteroidetes bacterium]|nr:hypothetical protein [Bacteroidota bacterium]